MNKATKVDCPINVKMLFVLKKKIELLLIICHTFTQSVSFLSRFPQPERLPLQCPHRGGGRAAALRSRPHAVLQPELVSGAERVQPGQAAFHRALCHPQSGASRPAQCHYHKPAGSQRHPGPALAQGELEG